MREKKDSNEAKRVCTACSTVLWRPERLEGLYSRNVAVMPRIPVRRIKWDERCYFCLAITITTEKEKDKAVVQRMCMERRQAHSKCKRMIMKRR